MPAMQSTAAMLGYDDDARLLIVNADDFGMCHANNAGITEAFQDGIVTSTSLMAPCPWAPQAMQMLHEHPDLPFAVHLTLVRDFAPYTWKPVASTDRVSSLVDETGGFLPFARRDELLARADIGEVEIEFRAQIQSVLRAGLRPTHLDWHCLADGGRPDIFALTFQLAQELGLALRIHLPESAAHCREHGLPVHDHPVLDSYRYTPDEKPQVFAELLRALPAGLTEWAVHPSIGDGEARALHPDDWSIRRADLDFVTSPVAREIIAEEGIILLDFRHLQTLWADAAQRRVDAS